jgi:hypothetical protein
MDIYKFSIKTLSDDESLDMQYPTSLESIVNQTKRGCYLRTIMTDGIVVYLLWSKNVMQKTTVTKAEYLKRQRNAENYAKKKEEKIQRQINEHGKPDKRTTRKRDPPIMKDIMPIRTSGLGNRTHGLFSKSALQEKSIGDNVPIVSIDPGFVNVFTVSTKTA